MRSSLTKYMFYMFWILTLFNETTVAISYWLGICTVQLFDYNLRAREYYIARSVIDTPDSGHVPESRYNEIRAQLWTRDWSVDRETFATISLNPQGIGLWRGAGTTWCVTWFKERLLTPNFREITDNCSELDSVLLLYQVSHFTVRQVSL